MGGRGEGTGGFPRQKKGGNNMRKGVGTHQKGCVNLLGETRTHDLAVCGSSSDYCTTPHEFFPMAHTHDTHTRMHMKCPEALREDLRRQPRLLGILPLGRLEDLQDPQDLLPLLCGARRACPASEPRLRAWKP